MEKYATSETSNELSNFIQKTNMKGKEKENKPTNPSSKKSVSLVTRIYDKIKNFIKTNKKMGFFFLSIFVFIIIPGFIEYENFLLREYVQKNGINQSKLMQYEKRMQSGSQAQYATRRY